MWASDRPFQVESETYCDSVSLIASRFFPPEDKEGHILAKALYGACFGGCNNQQEIQHRDRAILCDYRRPAR